MNIKPDGGKIPAADFIKKSLLEGRDFTTASFTNYGFGNRTTKLISNYSVAKPNTR